MTPPPIPRIVTIGGGHGQANLLAALRKVRCEVTAVVSVADDGGCSGKLRTELGMPPPGDLRRCLSTLAADRELADRFELRLFEPGLEGRCAGNLVLSTAFLEFGSLQRAVDWAAALLHCEGRVVPVAETPGVLVVYDLRDGRMEGETHVAKASTAPIAAMVHGPSTTNPVALDAIRSADFVLLGPGSFFTSTIATVTTGTVAEALVASQCPKVLITNLTDEGFQTTGFSDVDYARILRDHLLIASMGGSMDLSVLHHVDGPDQTSTLADGTTAYGARVALPGSSSHDPDLLAGALCRRFGWEPRASSPPAPPSHDSRAASFEQYLKAATKHRPVR
jgi:uncharacterized cofD-like protein